MERGSIEEIVKALNGGGVRYLVAGGLAVVAHGYVRFTADLDIILDMDEANLRRAARALSSLGYRPRAPVPLDAFADAKERERWVAEKGLTVFSLWSPQHAATEVDLFVRQPFEDFDKAYAAASRFEIAPGVTMTVVGLDDLFRLKVEAGRPRDAEDIERLQRLNGNGDGD
ncbi:MAG: hypothetical protein PHU25_15430 [Deltaproteobacteria bacterium]|nr:hypothetical protein [Deltaproteobacteria bacterium]